MNFEHLERSLHETHRGPGQEFSEHKGQGVGYNTEIMKDENSLTWLGIKIGFELISCFVLILGENGCLLAKNINVQQ